QFIQHEVREQGRERAALRGPLPAFLELPAIEHTGGQISPDEPENPPIRNPLRHRGEQSVVIDPVEEFGQVDIYDKPVAVDDVGLCLCHRLVSGASRPEAVAVLAECRVPPRLKPLQDRLLGHAIDHGGNAEIARPAGRLRDPHPTHRLRLVAPLEQLIFDLRPARFKDARQLLDGDTVHAGRAFIAHHCTQCRFYVVRITDRLHEMLCGCRAFGFGRRRDRFDLLHVPARGFTPVRHRQAQFELVWRSRFGHETPDLFALSFNPLSGTVWAFGRRTGLLCPLLTSAPRSGRLATASVPKDTAQISRSKPDSLHRTPAGFTVLALDGYGLCDILPARPTSAASYPVSVRRVATLLHASFRRSLAVPPLRFASASPPSGCTGDFHPQTVGHVRHTGWRCAPPLTRLKALTGAALSKGGIHRMIPLLRPSCSDHNRRS